MAEIDLPTARAIAQRHLSESRHEFVINDARTEERVFGWVFRYVPRRFLETGDPDDLVPGSSPIIVTRIGGLVTIPTNRPAEQFIREFETIWIREFTRH